MRKGVKKILSEVVTTTKENLNGEITISTDAYVVLQEPNFVKVYLNDLLYLNDLSKGINKVLYSLLRKMNYDNEIILNSSVKKDIAEENSTTLNSVNQYITDLVNKEILIRQKPGIYYGNPKWFGKGEWKNIRKLRLQLEYTTTGKTLKTGFELDLEHRKYEENNKDYNERF